MQGDINQLEHQSIVTNQARNLGMGSSGNIGRKPARFLADSSLKVEVEVYGEGEDMVRYIREVC